MVCAAGASAQRARAGVPRKGTKRAGRAGSGAGNRVRDSGRLCALLAGWETRARAPRGSPGEGCPPPGDLQEAELDQGRQGSALLLLGSHASPPVVCCQV